MTAARLCLGVILAGLSAGAAAGQAKRFGPRVASTSSPARAAAQQPTLLDYVDPAVRGTVAEVMAKPTLTARAAEDSFAAHPPVYEWLLDHPDRVSLAWRRLRVPAVDIDDLGGGRFRWRDESGSELVWQTAAAFADGKVWYASGKVNPGSLLPTVPVKAVAVLRYPKQADPAGGTTLSPEATVYLFSDSRAAAALLRLIGPAAPRMANDAAEQFLYYFSGIAAHLHKHPEQLPALLGPAKK